MPHEDRVDEPFAVQEIWLDGFSGVHINGETLRCTAFSMQDDGAQSHPIAVVKLVMSISTARHFMAQSGEALNMKIAGVRLVRNRRKPG